MAKDKRKPSKERRIKVGEWVFTFGKVTGFYGRHHVIVRIGSNEYTLLRSELWNPNDAGEGTQ
jgi:hypothetical protein